MKLEFSRQNFEKFSNVKFNKNPSIGSKVFYASDRWTDMKMLVTAFRNFAKALINLHIFPKYYNAQSCNSKWHYELLAYNLLVYRVAKR
jgi:hypothetical protein